MFLASAEVSAGPSTEKTRLPDDLFFDTFIDQNRSLYQAGSVRIAASRFHQYGAMIPLEECAGPFNALFRSGWSILPMPESILIFTPQKRKGELWKDFERGLEEQWLYEKLVENDPLGPIDFPNDTREVDGYTGPSIFISFTWADVLTVRKIASALYKRRRRYYLLAGPFQGIGGTASTNSTESVNQADIVLICASSNYALRFRDAPNGNIAKEIFAMNRRIDDKDGLRIAVLSIDSYREIADKLPWSQLGFDEVPFIGKPLKHASDEDFEEAIREVLQAIDH